MKELRLYTMARVALERAGNSLATRELLEFQLAHALARDAVHLPLDVISLRTEMATRGWDALVVESAARDRATYLRRPDLGRRLSPAAVEKLGGSGETCNITIIVADGLSAMAVHRQALPLLDALMPLLQAAGWKTAPLVIAEQARVAIGDEIGQALGADICLMLIGERPGLSAPDSLGAYLTWRPKPGRMEAERNCISNIRSEGLAPADAALRIFALASEARRRQLTGFSLKEETVKEETVALPGADSPSIAESR